MMSTVLTPTAGTIRVNGHDTQASSSLARASLSVVPASGWLSLDSHLTVGQNLEFWGRLFGLPQALVRRRSLEARSAVGLANILSEQPTSLSSGMRQRLAIAKGLLARSPIFILDEPTANVDPVSSSNIQDFIRFTLNRDLGQTVVITTHDMSEAERLCDRVAIIDKGTLIACDTPNALIQRLQGRVVSVETEGALAETATVIREADIARHLQQISQHEAGHGTVRIVLRTGQSQSTLAQLLAGVGLVNTTIHRHVPTMEDVFFDLAGDWSDGSD